MNDSFKRKKFLTSVIIIIYQFLTGCEYAIIFPSAWAYLQSLGVTEEYWLGFTISAYSLSMGIAAVVGGRLADVYMHQTKSVVLISIALMALGNVQYAIGINLWNVLCSRLLCGVGTAAQSAMAAELCRVTQVEERTPILAVCNAAKQLGLFIAPAFQLLFSYFHFRVTHNFEINPLNAPGAFMGVVWLVFCVAAMAMFYNLTAELQEMQNSEIQEAQRRRQRKYYSKKQVEHDGALVPGQDRSPTSSTSDYGTVHDEGFEGSEEQRRASATSHALPKRSWHSADITLSESFDERVMNRRGKFGRATCAVYVKEFLTDTFVLLQSMVFTLYFGAIGVQTVIPMVMQEYFGCGVFQISLLYMGAGLAALIIYSSVAFFSKHMRDSTLQLLGYSVFTAAHVWLIVILPLCERGKPIHLAFFTTGCMLMFIGYPIASIANNGLTAKVLSAKTQGLGQGLRRLMGSLGLIYGPSWAASTVRQPYWLLGVPIFILLLNGLMLTDNLPQLRGLEDNMNEDREKNEKSRAKTKYVGEEEPLLTTD